MEKQVSTCDSIMYDSFQLTAVFVQFAYNSINTSTLIECDGK